MALLGFLFLLFCYLLSGYGVLGLFGLRPGRTYTVTLSLLLGIAVASFIPFLLQLFYIILNPASVFLSLLLAALLLNIPVYKRLRRNGFPLMIRVRKEGFPAVLRSSFSSFRILPYEIPYFVVLGFLMFVSIWRCYYLPPTSRDVLSGPEAIAEFAVREHTMINSFFKVDLWSTNNQFKSPFLISLQMIYKMAGFNFGQVWLSIIFVSFTLFLYRALKQRLHPVIAGLLLLLFTMIPEMYAYTFLILYDYSNMVFFFLSLYFLFGYFRNRSVSHFYFAGLLMGIATYIRSETLALALLFLPPILLSSYRTLPVKKIGFMLLFFFLPSFIGYFLPTQLYIKYYLPVHYDVENLVNTHLGNIRPLFQRYSDIVTRLMTGRLATELWGYILPVAALLFLGELLFVRSFTRDARNWLYAIAVLYLGLGALGFFLPLINLDETTKRALFKLMPLVLLYLANNQLLQRLSERISRWEINPALPPFARKAAAEVSTAANSVPAKTVLTKTGKTLAQPVSKKKLPKK
jgi:hypothetical protein